jgi:hypothetical protein
MERWPGDISLDRLVEKGFFVAESGVHAGAVDAHGLLEVGQRCPIVTLAPKDLERRVERFVGIESSGASRGHKSSPWQQNPKE